MKTSTIFFLFFSISIANAQVITPEMQGVIDDFQQLKIRDWESYKHTVEGSPYFFDEFKEAIVVSTDKSELKGTLVRYNIYQDQMEIKKKDNYFAFTKDTAVFYQLIIDSIAFELIPVGPKRNLLKYAEVIASGTISIYAQHKVIFKEAVKPKGYADAVPPQYNRQIPEYYLKTRNKEFIRIKSLKQLAAIFTEQNDEINKYIKRNKLKFRKKEDLKTLMDFINTISR